MIGCEIADVLFWISLTDLDQSASLRLMARSSLLMSCCLRGVTASRLDGSVIYSTGAGTLPTCRGLQKKPVRTAGIIRFRALAQPLMSVARVE
jgi:hypothetical protein